MDAGLIVFVVVVAVIVAGAVWLRRRDDRDLERADPGDAILEFGAAFPGNAVRDVVTTVDGGSTFLRLTDDRVGLVQNENRHHRIRIIDGRSVRVAGPVGDRGLAIGFDKGTEDNDAFVFATVQDAAEVSLWLCGGLATKRQRPAAGETA